MRSVLRCILTRVVPSLLLSFFFPLFLPYALLI